MSAVAFTYEIHLIIATFKLIILVPTFSESKSHCTNSSSVFCTIHLFLEKKRPYFSHFPIFLAREGYPENTTHFNQVTVIRFELPKNQEKFVKEKPRNHAI